MMHQAWRTVVASSGRFLFRLSSRTVASETASDSLKRPYKSASYSSMNSRLHMATTIRIWIQDSLRLSMRFFAQEKSSSAR